MKEFIRKIWDAIVSFISKVPYDKLLHFVAGLIVAAFFAIALKWPGWAALLMSVAFGALKELFDWLTTKKVEWWDGIATSIGGVVILVFWLLGLWWC